LLWFGDGAECLTCPVVFFFFGWMVYEGDGWPIADLSLSAFLVFFSRVGGVVRMILAFLFTCVPFPGSISFEGDV